MTQNVPTLLSVRFWNWGEIEKSDFKNMFYNSSIIINLPTFTLWNRMQNDVILLYIFQPLMTGYEEFSPKIDEVNDLGTAYDALQRGEQLSSSPIRRSKYQPG